MLALIVFLGLSPLIRFSLEDSFLPRDTKIIIIACVAILCACFFVYYSRVHKTLRKILPILLIATASAFGFGILPFNPVGLLYWILATCVGTFVWILRKHRVVSPTILAATLIGCIGMYSQWGIAQFIVQHDLGMHVLGESRLSVGIPGVATFSTEHGKYIRSYGPFAHPNSLAGSILIGGILLYALKPSSRLYTVSMLLIFSIGILTSFSRSGLIGFAIVLLAFILSSRHSIIAMSIIPFLLFSSLLFQRSFDPRGVALMDRATGISWFIGMTTPQSILRGYGVGNYETALVSYLYSHHITYDPWDIAPLHSGPLLLFSELGLVLSTVFALILFALSRHYRSPILLAILPPVLTDHYFVTQFGSTILLITCVILVVQYRGGHRTN